MIQKKEFQSRNKLIEIIKQIPQRVRKDSIRDEFTKIIDSIAEKKDSDQRVYDLLRRLSEQEVHITEKDMEKFISEYNKL